MNATRKGSETMEIRDNTIVDQHMASVADKARIADEFAAKGDYQQAVYRLTDALLDLNAVIGQLKNR